MACLLLDNGVPYSTYSDCLTNGWVFATSGVSFGSGRYAGGKSFNLGNATNALIYGVPTPTPTLIVGFNFYPTSSVSFLYFSENGVTHGSLGYSTSTGKFSISVPGGGASTTNTFAANTWHHVQIKYTVGDSGSVTMRINGNTEMSYSGDTRNGQNGNIDALIWSSAGGGNNISFSDLFIFDTTGSVNNDIITAGEPRVEAVTVASVDAAGFTAVGAANQAQTIDETSQNGDTDYNEASSVNTQDTFAMTSLSGSAGTVYAVQPKIYARKTLSGLRKLSPVFKIGANTYVRNASSVNSNYAWVYTIEEQNPDTSAAWTVSDINNMKVGYKITT